MPTGEDTGDPPKPTLAAGPCVLSAATRSTRLAAALRMATVSAAAVGAPSIGAPFRPDRLSPFSRVARGPKADTATWFSRSCAAGRFTSSGATEGTNDELSGDTRLQAGVVGRRDPDQLRDVQQQI